MLPRDCVSVIAEIDSGSDAVRWRGGLWVGGTSLVTREAMVTHMRARGAWAPPSLPRLAEAFRPIAREGLESEIMGMLYGDLVVPMEELRGALMRLVSIGALDEDYYQNLIAPLIQGLERCTPDGIRRAWAAEGQVAPGAVPS